MEKDTEKKCFVCKNTVTRFDSDSGINRERQQGECQRFYSLVCRYLNINLDGSSGPVLNSSATDPNRTLKKRSCENIFDENEAISCCDICIPLIKSFSDTYNNWKILQLVLNWKLETITKLMLIKSKFEDEKDSSNSELFRKRFLALVKDKSRDYPRLIIPKVEDPPAIQKVNINDTTEDPCEPEPTEISDFENDGIEDFNGFNLQNHANEEQKAESDGKCLSSEEAKVEFKCKSMGMYNCQFCGKGFKDKFVCKKHEVIHKGKPYKCRICRKAFADTSNRRRHEKSHSHKRKSKSPEPKPSKPSFFHCGFCGKEFIKRDLCRRHERIHKEKLHKCRICEKAFIDASRRIRHEKIHSQERKITATKATAKYKCQLCSKQYQYKYNLTEHQRVHSGEQPYSCCVCQKKFSLASNWRKHERKHKKGQMWYEARKRDQSNWKFKCSFCSKKFDRESVQLMHEQIHTGEKPFSCRYCGKTFCRLFSKNRHELGHKPGEMTDAEKSKVLKSVKQEVKIENERNDDDNKDLENDAEDASSINLERIQVRIIKSEQDASEPHHDNDNEAMFPD